MKEIFKQIPGYEPYGVSIDGQVMNLKTGNILKARPSAKGYLIVSLAINKKSRPSYVHQLMAITYLNHTPNGMKIVIDHINENKEDNKLGNLQLISNRENTSRSIKRDLPTGVTKTPNNRYVARIRGVDSKPIYLGRHNTPEEAHNAYLDALNKIEQL